jgi:FkbM family methyltransferase
LDVGANVGFLAVPLAQAVYPRGALVAFEPLAANFHRLRENLRINGVLNDDAIYQLGLSDRRAVAMLSLRGDFRNGAATGNAAIVEGEGHGFDVERIELETLDDVFPRLKLDRLHFIKLDIEGHEIAFLAGAAATIKQFRPVIYTEINDFYFAERGERAAELFSRWADEHSYDFATIRRGRIERIVLHHMPNVLMDVFLVPQERFDWFLKAAGSR